METRCPVATLIGTLSKRWVMLIFMAIQNGKNTFNEIKRANPGMTSKILSERLSELENEKFIFRKITDSRPIKIEYGFTDKGHSLQYALSQLNNWALEHKEEILQDTPLKS